MSSKLVSASESCGASSQLKVTSIERCSFSFVWTISGFRKWLDEEYVYSKPFEFSSPEFSQHLPSGESKWRMTIFAYFDEKILFRLQKPSNDNRSYTVLYQVKIGTKDKYDETNKIRAVFGKMSYQDDVGVTHVSSLRNKLSQDRNLEISCDIKLAMCEETAS